MYEGLQDTIVAVCTPPGPGARGVVRISGQQALRLGSTMFSGASPRPPSGDGGWVRLCGMVDLGEPRLRVPGELFVFRAPRSYTREDVVEFHTSGCPAVLDRVVERAVRLGARPAGPGEFTARAFYHGGLSLDQVEGLAALIQARSDVQLRAAREWMDGHMATRIHGLQEQLVDLLSLVEADIDFAEEPIEFMPPEALHRRVADLADRLSDLLARSESTERLDVRPRVLLVGPPNAGKSTLLNRLSGTQRALCSNVAGTTRDLISTTVTLPGGQIEVFDSAGWGQNPGKFEKISENFVVREIRHMDLVCHLLDLSKLPLSGQVLPAVRARQGPVFWLGTKVDLVSEQTLQEAQRWVSGALAGTLLALSDVTGLGLETLRRALNEQLFGTQDRIEGHRVAIDRAHLEALRQACAALRRAQRRCRMQASMIDCAEWVAADLRSALHQLADVFGEVSVDDLLERIFSSFCIGK